jgi:aspartate aminotransferase-like enzyme
MTPPGLAFVSVTAAAQAAAREQEARSFYFDWGQILEAQAALDAAFTPAVSLVRALEVALGLILDAGLEAAFERHRRLGRACREGVKALGLDLFSPDDDSSAVVTAVRMPDGYDSGELVRALRDRFGITIANGQGELKGRIFRIGHIGYYDVFDVTTALAAVEVALGDLGVPIERGGAVTRALEAYEDAMRV